MRYISTLIVNIAFGTLAIAQTLDQGSQSLIIGTSFNYYFPAAYLSPGSSGAGQTWDFSSAVPTQNEPLLIQNPAGTPQGANYPNSDYALVYSMTVAYDYVELVSAGQFSFGGFDGDQYTDTRQDLSFPLSLNSTWSDGFSGTSGPNTTVSGTVNGTADATGTLVLPWGQVTDVLRVHRQTQTTTVSTNPSNTVVVDLDEYLFYKSGVPVPVVVSWTDDFGFQYSKYLSSLSTDVADLSGSQNEVEVFPNPAQENVTIVVGGSEKASVSFVTGLGQVLQASVVQTSGTTERMFSLSLADFSPGVYYVQVAFQNGLLTTKRLVVL